MSIEDNDIKKRCDSWPTTIGRSGFRKSITRMLCDSNLLKLHEEKTCRRNHKERHLSAAMRDRGSIDSMKSLLSNEELPRGAALTRSDELSTAM